MSLHILLFIGSQEIIIIAVIILLLFGGVNRGDRGGYNYLHSIYSYSIPDNKWKELNVRLTLPFSDFGAISCRNGKFVVLFGGHNPFYGGDSNDILIFDTEYNKFIDCNQKCPVYEWYPKSNDLQWLN